MELEASWANVNVDVTVLAPIIARKVSVYYHQDPSLTMRRSPLFVLDRRQRDPKALANLPVRLAKSLEEGKTQR